MFSAIMRRAAFGQHGAFAVWISRGLWMTARAATPRAAKAAQPSNEATPSPPNLDPPSLAYSVSAPDMPPRLQKTLTLRGALLRSVFGFGFLATMLIGTAALIHAGIEEPPQQVEPSTASAPDDKMISTWASMANRL
ncbi:MAG: hypothetical protein AAGG72_01270 [Pseudomonadota bacterium]